MSQRKVVTVDISKVKSTKTLVLLIAFILIAGAVSYYTDTQISIDLDLQMLLDEHWQEMNSTWYAHQQAYSYVISVVTSGGSDYACSQNGTTGRLEAYSSTDHDSIVEWAIGNASVNGGIVLIKSGDYTNVDVTAPSDVVLMLEVGVTGVTTASSGTGIVLKFAAGYVWSDAPLDMTGHQIVNGIFHSGTSFPPSPTSGQPFYRTTDHIFYVWNSTHWVDCFAGGDGGTVHDTRQTYDYLMYRVDDTYYAKNGTDELVDYSGTDYKDVVEDAMTALYAVQGGGVVHHTPGVFEVESALSERHGSWVGVRIPANIIFQGSGREKTIIKRISWSASAVLIDNRTTDGGDNDIIVRDLTIDHDSYPQQGQSGGNIGITGNRTVIRNIYSKNAKAAGISATGNEVLITECKVENCWTGILIWNLVSPDRPSCNITITNNQVWLPPGEASGNGIFPRYVKDCIVSGNIVAASDFCIGIDYVTGDASERCIVSDNVCYAEGGSGIGHGAGCNDMVYANNIIVEANTAISCSSGDRHIITGNVLYNFNMSGILAGGADGMVSDNTLKGGINAVRGIRLSVTEHTTSGNRIEGYSNTERLDYGIDIQATHQKISDNYIRWCTYGIWDEYDLYQATIENNEFKDCDYGIYQDESDYWRIRYNIFVSNVGTPITLGVGSPNNIVEFNQGYNTEGEGTDEASDGDTVSFGMTFAGTPQVVIVTVMEDGDYSAGAYSVSTTGFTLSLYDAGTPETVDQTISWYAKYAP